MQTYIHQSFPQPTDQSVTLWRYMNFDKFEWLVSEERLFMPCAERLNDPLEGITPQGELKFWNHLVMSAESEEKKRIIIYNRQYLSRMAMKFRRHYFVSCWHMNPYENYAMWQCYTAQSDSVCIKTTYATLRECLPIYAYIGVIRYIDYSNGRLPTMNMFEYIMHKDIFYSYEKEVRALVFEVAGNESSDILTNLYEKDDMPGFFVYAPRINIRSLIQGIVLHPDASTTFEEKLIKMCAINELPKPERSRKTCKVII